MIRKAAVDECDAVTALYELAHDAESAGIIHTGWKRGIYPTEETVRAALLRDDLFVLCEKEKIIGAAIINQIQPHEYRSGQWMYQVKNEQVMVIHTLFIDPSRSHQGCGTAFLDFYEKYAAENGCTHLRLDTNAVNTAARTFYRKNGYREAGSVKTVFNGIDGVQLILLEKKIEK